MDSLFEIKRTEAKGYGVFARRAIPSNTTIVQERPILKIPSTNAGPAASDARIEAAFKKLHKQDQARVLQLHEGSHPTAKTKVTRIFHANAFGDGDDEMLFPTVSRVNHSCVPNASVHQSGGRIRSDRQIAAGEEIIISYLPPFSEAMTARQRATVLQLHYGFECHCVACWPLKQRWMSDARRQLIGFISYALKGQNAPDFTPLNRCHSTSFANWPPQPTPSGRILTANQEIEYNFLLANLREAEGIPLNLAAVCYAEASMKLAARQFQFEKVPAMNNIVFLEAARCIKAWYERGLQLDGKFYGAGHERVREGKQVWEDLKPKLPCLQILAMASVINGSSIAKGSVRMEDAFAVLMSEDLTMEALSQEQTAALISKRRQVR